MRSSADWFCIIIFHSRAKPTEPPTFIILEIAFSNRGCCMHICHWQLWLTSPTFHCGARSCTMGWLKCLLPLATFSISPVLAHTLPPELSLWRSRAEENSPSRFLDNLSNKYCEPRWMQLVFPALGKNSQWQWPNGVSLESAASGKPVNAIGRLTGSFPPTKAKGMLKIYCAIP